MKRLFAVLMAFSMLFAFSSCKDNGEDTALTPEIVTDQNGETVTNEDGDAVTKNATAGETVLGSEEASTGQATVAESSSAVPDPSSWTKEEIVEFYKNAAVKSKTAVKSKQQMTMSSMVVNEGDGFIGTMVELATPIMKSALAKNSTEFDGITGGYEDLVVTDAETVKAYKSGEYTVVEMTMKEQTDGIHGDTYSGTVGHAISVVGDISSVAEALPQFVIDFENADLKLRYTEPKLKVKINKDGIIEKGTWTYTVDVTVANLHIAAANFPIEVMIESAHGSVDYLITVGGGF